MSFVVCLGGNVGVRMPEGKARLLLRQLHKVVELHHICRLKTLEIFKVRDLSPKLHVSAHNKGMQVLTTQDSRRMTCPIIERMTLAHPTLINEILTESSAEHDSSR